MSTLTRDDVTVLSTDLKGWRGDAWLIRVGGMRHFVISAIPLPETMAFASNERGVIDSWSESAVVRAYDHEACIAVLLAWLAEGGAS